MRCGAAYIGAEFPNNTSQRIMKEINIVTRARRMKETSMQKKRQAKRVYVRVVRCSLAAGIAGEDNGNDIRTMAAHKSG